MGLISRVSSRTYRLDQKNYSKMPPKIQKSKEAKAKAAMSSGKGKKKKWSKGKVRDKVTYDKFNKEVPTYKIVTASIASERMKVRASLAKRALARLAAEGKLVEVVKHSAQVVYTKLPAAAEAKKE